MQQDKPQLGVILMITTMLIFAAQDGVSRHLAETEIFVMVTAFVRLGLVGSHAIFACFPLIVTALSMPILGEQVGWRRWTAVGVGFIGVLFILRPGFQVFTLDVLIPLLAAVMFAFYHILTRMVAADDTAETSFFWTGIAGAVAVTLVGPFFWEPMIGGDWYWMALLCVLSALGHFLLIQALTFAQASTIQPFSYFQLVFASLAGVVVFGEALDQWTIVGGLVVVAAGLFANRRSFISPLGILAAYALSTFSRPNPMGCHSKTWNRKRPYAVRLSPIICGF